MIDMSKYVRMQRERIALGLRAQRLAENGAQEEAQFWLSLAGKIAEEEEKLGKQIEEYGKTHPLWEVFASRIRGVGPLLFGKMVARLDPIGIHNFAYPSALWRWCGLAVVEGTAQNRLTGDKAQQWKFDRELRRFLYQLTDCFVKQGGYYREHYDRFRAQAEQKHPDWTPGHIHNHAMRLTGKLFLAHLWEEARKLHGLPVHQPYAIAKLGHVQYYGSMVEKEPKRKQRAVPRWRPNARKRAER